VKMLSGQLSVIRSRAVWRLTYVKWIATIAMPISAIVVTFFSWRHHATADESVVAVSLFFSVAYTLFRLWAFLPFMTAGEKKHEPSQRRVRAAAIALFVSVVFTLLRLWAVLLFLIWTDGEQKHEPSERRVRTRAIVLGLTIWCGFAAVSFLLSALASKIIGFGQFVVPFGELFALASAFGAVCIGVLYVVGPWGGRDGVNQELLRIFSRAEDALHSRMDSRPL
jgi:MFS family permease